MRFGRGTRFAKWLAAGGRRIRAVGPSRVRIGPLLPKGMPSDRTGQSRDRSILMKARGIPLPPPVCPSASEIAARLPRITTARDGVAAAPGLSSLRDSVMSARCGRRTARHFRQLAVIKIAIQALISEVFSPVALTKIEV